MTSWGDHTIERYRLVPRGASFAAQREVVVQGNTNFRPVGMAVAPDGSLYFSDWVQRSYQLHKHGRIWRLSPPERAVSDTMEPPEHVSPEDDPFARAQQVHALAERSDLRELAQERNWPQEPSLDYLRAMRLRHPTPSEELVLAGLNSDDWQARLFTVRWVCDEHIEDYRAEIASFLEGDLPNERYYLSLLAAVDWLSRDPERRHSQITDALLARELRREDRTPEQKAIALRLIAANHELLSPDKMRLFLDSKYEPLRVAAVQTLAQQTSSESSALLAKIAENEQESAATRADAIAGLATAARQYQALLEKLVESDEQSIRREALRILRLTGLASLPAEAKPIAEDVEAWLAELDQPGDPESGRRLFYSSVGAKCSTCHQYRGRGGKVGPELTNIGVYRPKKHIVRSILSPDDEIAPRYVPWMLETADGRTWLGLRLPEGGDAGKEHYLNAQGERFTLASREIVSRRPSEQSIMPARAGTTCE